jgi:hypothetical protein
MTTQPPPINKWTLDVTFLEQGDIYFFYKPKRGRESVNGFYDVGRFYFVLQPNDKPYLRFIVLGARKMPEVTDENSRAGWAVIQKVGGRGYRVTKQKGMTKTSARAVAEGVYALAHHSNHTHFLYSLELPKRIFTVQKTFGLAREANYVLVSKPAPGLGIQDEQRFTDITDINVLNYVGTELLFTAGKSTISRLGVTVKKDEESERTADIFSRLEMSKNRHPTDPMFFGRWV